MRKILALIGAAAAALAGILVFLSLTNDAQLSEEESAQIQTGIEAVRALESKNVADIEKKIESNAAPPQQNRHQQSRKRANPRRQVIKNRASVLRPLTQWSWEILRQSRSVGMKFSMTRM